MCAQQQDIFENETEKSGVLKKVTSLLYVALAYPNKGLVAKLKDTNISLLRLLEMSLYAEDVEKSLHHLDVLDINGYEYVACLCEESDAESHYPEGFFKVFLSMAKNALESQTEDALRFLYYHLSYALTREEDEGNMRSLRELLKSARFDGVVGRVPVKEYVKNLSENPKEVRRNLGED